jgi:hypothetical protein
MHEILNACANTSNQIEIQHLRQWTEQRNSDAGRAIAVNLDLIEECEPCFVQNKYETHLHKVLQGNSLHPVTKFRDT